MKHNEVVERLGEITALLNVQNARIDALEAKANKPSLFARLKAKLPKVPRLKVVLA